MGSQSESSSFLRSFKIILTITLFTFYFTSQMLTRPFEESR